MGSPNKEWIRVDVLDEILADFLYTAELKLKSLTDGGPAAQMAYLSAHAYLTAIQELSNYFWKHREDFIVVGAVEKVGDE